MVRLYQTGAVPRKLVVKWCRPIRCEGLGWAIELESDNVLVLRVAGIQGNGIYSCLTRSISARQKKSAHVHERKREQPNA